MSTNRKADRRPNGSFTLLGNKRKSIPEGRYRIGVALLTSKGKDRWDGQFGPANSPIIRDVKGQEINIDLDRPGE